jgi:hypothetical protein
MVENRNGKDDGSSSGLLQRFLHTTRGQLWCRQLRGADPSSLRDEKNMVGAFPGLERPG